MSKKLVSREEVSQWVEKDLGMVVSFVNMIRCNPDIQNALIDVIHQRLVASEMDVPETVENGGTQR